MRALIVKGKVWKFGNNISTDLMMPGFIREKNPDEVAIFCMQANRPEFARQVSQGDVIVAGKNFGCGSARPVTRILKALGISCVIAETVARLFFRNSVNEGFPIMCCHGVSEVFNEGDILEANFVTGKVKNITSGNALTADPLPEVAIRILNAGSTLDLLKQEYGKRKKVNH